MRGKPLPEPPPMDDDIWLGYLQALDDELLELSSADSSPPSPRSPITLVGLVLNGPVYGPRGGLEMLEAYPDFSLDTARPGESCCPDSNCAAKRRLRHG